MRQGLDTLIFMVSYVELCQAIEQWQRTQGRVSSAQSRLQQAMWRAFIDEHAPNVEMEFQGQGAEPTQGWDEQPALEDLSYAETGT